MSKQIILTEEGLAKLKGELMDVEKHKLPGAEKELKEICEVWGKGDPPYKDAKEQLDFYRGRVKFLSKVIENAVWNEEKGFYESTE